jgi:hypothetical protein
MFSHLVFAVVLYLTQSLSTSMTVGMSPTQPVQGQPVTLTAKLTAAGGATVNGGSVAFSVGPSVIGTAQVSSNGVAKIAWTPTVAGAVTVKAAFSTHFSDTSENIPITVAPCVQCTAPSGAVAPVFSTASGAVTPGTGTVPSTSTSGADIIYSVDGSTPSYYRDANGIAHPTLGTKSQVYNSTYTPTFYVYGPMTFKAIAAKSGLADSSVTTATYTITPPTGTSISACGPLTASTTYNLTADVSATGNCFTLNGGNITFNGNGHTITYGTGDSAIASGTNMTVTSGSLTATVPTATFTGGMVGDAIFISQTGSGAYQNIQATISTVNSSTSITVSPIGTFPTTINWSQSTAKYLVSPPPHHAFYCDVAVTTHNCPSSTLYNFTYTQSANSAAGDPNSHGIFLGNENLYNSGDGTELISNTVGNVSGLQVMCIEINGSPFGNGLAFDTCNDTSPGMFYRDGLGGYNFKFQNGYSQTQTTPTGFAHDLVCNNGPQGCVEAEETVNVGNNYANLGGITEYVAGYCAFLRTDFSVYYGGTCSGATRGIEIEASNQSILGAYINIADAAIVNDPNHNPPGCEIDGAYGVRGKDYAVSFNSMTNMLLSNNDITISTPFCPGQGIRMTQIGSSDSGTFGHNIIAINATANVSLGTNFSSCYSADQSNLTGVSYGSTNTCAKNGTYASSLYTVGYGYDGVQGLSISGMVSPNLYNQATVPVTPAASPTTGTFAGSGTMTATHVGGANTCTVTYNGTGVPCS